MGVLAIVLDLVQLSELHMELYCKRHMNVNMKGEGGSDFVPQIFVGILGFTQVVENTLKIL